MHLRDGKPIAFLSLVSVVTLAGCAQYPNLTLSPSPRMAAVAIGKNPAPIGAGRPLVVVVPFSQPHYSNTAAVNAKTFLDLRWWGMKVMRLKESQQDLTLVGRPAEYARGNVDVSDLVTERVLRALEARGMAPIRSPETSDRFKRNAQSARALRMQPDTRVALARELGAEVIVAGDVDLCRNWLLLKVPKEGGYAWCVVPEVGVSLWLFDGSDGTFVRSVHHRLSGDQVIHYPVHIRGKDLAEGKTIDAIPSLEQLLDTVVSEAVSTLLNVQAVAPADAPTALRAWCTRPPETVQWDDSVHTRIFFQQVPGHIVIGKNQPGRPVYMEDSGTRLAIGIAPVHIPVDVQFLWGRSVFQKFDVGYFAKICGQDCGVQQIAPGKPQPVAPGLFLVLNEGELVQQTSASLYVGSLEVRAEIETDNGSLTPVRRLVRAADFLDSMEVHVD